MIPPFAQNLHRLLQKNRSWSNLNRSAVAASIVSLIYENVLDGPIWIVTPSEKECQLLFQDLETWWFQQGLGGSDWNLLHFPADDVQVLYGLCPTQKDTQQRVTTLHLLHTHSKSVIVSSLFAALHFSLTPETIQGYSLHLEIGEDYDFENLCQKLVHLGYERYNVFDKQDLHCGQFEQRGELVRVWPIDKKNPVQLHFFDTELESIETLNSRNFLPISEHVSFDVLPAKECIIDPSSIQHLSQKIISHIREISKDRTEINQHRAKRKRILEELQNGIASTTIFTTISIIFEIRIIDRNCSIIRCLNCWTM